MGWSMANLIRPRKQTFEASRTVGTRRERVSLDTYADELAAREKGSENVPPLAIFPCRSSMRFSGRVKSSSLFSVPGPLREDCCETTGVCWALACSTPASDSAAKTSVPAASRRAISLRNPSAHTNRARSVQYLSRESVPINLVGGKKLHHFSFDPQTRNSSRVGPFVLALDGLDEVGNIAIIRCRAGQLLGAFKRRCKISLFTTKAHDSQ